MKKYLYSFCILALCAIFFTNCKDKENNVTGISLNKNTLSLAIGVKDTLVTTIMPDNADNKNVVWSSDKPEVVTVDKVGIVTAVAAGTAKITVTTEDGGKTATCIVNVTNIAVTGVTINKTTLSLVKGTEEILMATVTPDNATNKKVMWTSDKLNIATVDNNGKVTAIATGTTNIIVKTEDGNKTATCVVTVTESSVAVTGITLSPTTLSLAVDGTSQLTKTVAPANATNTNVTWTSDKPNIVTVDNTGKVTAIATGTTNIIVKTEDGNKTATCVVTVTPVLVSSVSFNKTSLSLVANTQETLTATVAPDNAANTSLEWLSSNPAVATVDNGKVVALAAGSTNITATSKDGSSKMGTCIVTVTASSVAVTGVSLNKTTLSLIVGTEESLMATVAPETATNKNVTWTSDKPEFATVVNGLVTAVAAGTATITVTTEDGNETATCTVTVVQGNLILHGNFVDCAYSETTVAGVLGTGWYAEPIDKGDPNVAPWGQNKWVIKEGADFPLTCFTDALSSPILTFYRGNLINGTYTLSVTGKSGWGFFLTANQYDAAHTTSIELVETAGWQTDDPGNTGTTYSTDIEIKDNKITVGFKFVGDFNRSAAIKEIKLIKK